MIKMAKRRSRLKADTRKQKNKNIENTAEWRAAEWDYTAILANDRFPLLSPPLIGQKRIERLKEILAGCPEYYPVLFDLGYRYVQEGMDDNGKEYMDKGFESLKTLFNNKNVSKKELIETYYYVCEFLEKYLRFEMALEYYNQLLEIENDKANVYDHISYCFAYLGVLEKAFEAQNVAIKLNDSNPRFFCNLGWVEFLRGNIDAAKDMLERALELKSNDEITKNNYDVYKLMHKNKKLKTWEDYLLRPIDYEDLDKLKRKNDFEKYSKQVQLWNSERLEAFKFHLIRNTNYSLSEKYDIMFTLNYIFDLTQELDLCDNFFYEDAAEVEFNFKLIMHKVILKTGDIDEEIFIGAYTALLEFYKFLAMRKVISSPAHRRLRKEMLELKPELIEKMNRYNEIRHNDEYSEEEKEEVREELFEGDYYYPF